MASAPEEVSGVVETQAIELREFHKLYETAEDHHKRFITHRQEHKDPVDLLPLDELQIKLDKLEKVIKLQREHRNKPNWEPNAIQFCFLLNLPLDELTAIWNNYKWSNNVLHYLDNVGPLTSYFLQKAQYVSTKRDRNGTNEDVIDRVKWLEAALDKLDTTRINRKEPELQECKKNDGGHCIVTGVANPDACHIIPFAFNNSDKNTKKTSVFSSTIRTMLGLPGNKETEDAIALLHQGKGSSDKQWNMICLSPSLHRWWGYAYWAFKWLDAAPITNDTKTCKIRLQFHWMPRNIKRDPTASFRLKDLPDLDKQIKHCYGSEPYLCNEQNCQACYGTKGIAAHNVESGRPIRTGDIFTIIRSTIDVPLCRTMFDIQWAIITSAAISGGALVPDQLGDFSFPPGDFVFSYEDIKDNVEEDEETRSRVQSWIDQNSPEPQQEL
ncbi:hypothetical protein LZL87_009333 [Fusarium oxysporum]|nr:hypothetical protein LZL87_009333 [Fusarium oxysporum]